jgi:hypothetical protein
MQRWILIGFIFSIILFGCEIDSSGGSINVDTNTNSGEDSNASSEDVPENGNSNDENFEPLSDSETGYIKIKLEALDSTTEPEYIELLYDKGPVYDFEDTNMDFSFSGFEPLVIKIESKDKFINAYVVEAYDTICETSEDSIRANRALFIFPVSLSKETSYTATGEDYLDMDKSLRHLLLDIYETDENQIETFIRAPNITQFEEVDDTITYSVNVDNLQIGFNTIAGTFSTEYVYVGIRNGFNDQEEVGAYKLSVDFKLRESAEFLASIISYDGNGATYGSGPGFSLGYATGGYISRNDGNEIISPFIKSGYIFSGWNSKMDGTGESFIPGERYSSDQDILLYSQWKEPYQIEVTDTGFIYYENPNYQSNDEWKYLEIAKNPINADYSVPWSNVMDSLTGTSKSIGDGDSNSLAIVNQIGHTESAAQCCLDYDEGVNGWYLPSSGELAEAIYQLVSYYGTEFTLRAWTSTEVSPSEAYSVDSEYLCFIHDKFDDSDYPYYAPIYPVRKLDSNRCPIPLSY